MGTLQSCFLELANADSETFKVLNNVYSKDSKHVYFYSRKIDADASTFKVLSHLFASDKNGIWYNGRLANVKDVESFKVIPTEIENKEFHFSQDKYGIYSSTEAKIQFHGYASTLMFLKTSDPHTFKEINEVWAKDKNNVYWFGKTYKKADAETFEQISKYSYTEFDYARDKNHVYINNGITLKKGLHGASFEILNQFWAQDKNQVYLMPSHRIIKTIHRPTFKVIGDAGKAEDKDYFYQYINHTLKKEKKTQAQ